MNFQKAYKVIKRAYWQFKTPCYMIQVQQYPEQWKVYKQYPYWDQPGMGLFGNHYCIGYGKLS